MFFVKFEESPYILEASNYRNRYIEIFIEFHLKNIFIHVLEKIHYSTFLYKIFYKVRLPVICSLLTYGQCLVLYFGLQLQLYEPRTRFNKNILIFVVEIVIPEK